MQIRLHLWGGTGELSGLVRAMRAERGRARPEIIDLIGNPAG
jgi:hypothetical protein